MPSCTCFGACKGDPQWRDPVTGFACNVCGGSGVSTGYSQRELALKEWEHFKASQRARAERADKKREERADQRRAREYREASVADASMGAR